MRSHEVVSAFQYVLHSDRYEQMHQPILLRVSHIQSWKYKSTQLYPFDSFETGKFLCIPFEEYSLFAYEESTKMQSVPKTFIMVCRKTAMDSEDDNLFFILISKLSC